MNKIFFFDLDGTVTSEEILPKIAKRFGFHKKMHKLTASAILGNVPFEESFRYRHKILSKYDLKKIRGVIKSIMINKNIKDFINTNSKQCRIVTGNLDAWIKPLQKKINCKFYTSTSTHNGKIIEKVMKKGEILKKYKNYTKIFIGDGFNDISAFREAHIKIAVNFIHKPPEQLINMCNYYFSNSKKLCQFLEQL